MNNLETFVFDSAVYLFSSAERLAVEKLRMEVERAACQIFDRQFV